MDNLIKILVKNAEKQVKSVLMPEMESGISLLLIGWFGFAGVSDTLHYFGPQLEVGHGSYLRKKAAGDEDRAEGAIYPHRGHDLPLNVF